MTAPDTDDLPPALAPAGGATDTYLLLRAFCQELARCGVTDACTSPGSRSTPLVLSLARQPGLRAWSHLDERVAGFFAVGLAKASGRPVPIACTSGTAAAELAPAVIEAAEARVPLIVLTADRPPELRDVGAGQTIDQIKLYGGAAKWFVEVGTHEATPERVRWMRALACRAVWTALDGRPGPVHLNFPLREPLVLDGPLPEEDPAPARADGRPWVAHPVVPVPAELPPVPIAPTPRTVVVAGREERDPALGEAVAAFAAAARCPLLADPLSGASRGPAAIAHYDALLRDERLAAELRPELVLRVGDLPTSKPLRTWLAGLDGVEQIALDGEGAWHDPAGVVTARIAASPRAALAALTPEHRDAGDPAWLDRWRDADGAAAGAIAAALGDELSEPRVAAELADALPPEATLFVASSMPIRDLETFAAARHDPPAPRVLSNRGANGIDGTVAAALGAAAAGDGPVVLHIGDVALAYDLTALLSARRLGLDLVVVLVNNDGGGIFHFLPVASEGDAFELHVATPHGLDFAQAAALFGARHVAAASAAALREAVLDALGRPGVTIVEVRTEREANVALHRRVWAAVGDALRALADRPAAGR
jgi:2-succinyl-5-enolpyruvyl-6-hydroxy-3-cyclohexene-1-carboxylate synthase